MCSDCPAACHSPWTPSGDQRWPTLFDYRETIIVNHCCIPLLFPRNRILFNHHYQSLMSLTIDQLSFARIFILWSLTIINHGSTIVHSSKTETVVLRRPVTAWAFCTRSFTLICPGEAKKNRKPSKKNAGGKSPTKIWLVHQTLGSLMFFMWFIADLWQLSWWT